MEKITMSSCQDGRKRIGSPKVWRVMEGRKKTGDGKTVKFSIQEIPEDRHKDVLNFMSKFFIRDEVMCKHFSKFPWPHGWINLYGYNFICTILHYLGQLLPSEIRGSVNFEISKTIVSDSWPEFFFFFWTIRIYICYLN